MATRVNVSLENIYNEILQLACSVGKCEASIEHTEDVIIRVHGDLKASLDKIDDRLGRLEEAETIRRHRSKFMWNLMSLSPSNCLKWIGALILAISMIATIIKIDLTDVVMKLIGFVASMG